MDDKTIGIYNDKADDYLALTIDDAENPDLTAFIDAVHPGTTVLDLGCGPGLSAAAMARAGLDVVAIDASSEMVRHAGAHPGVTARLGTFDEPGDGPYAGVWANFSLLHAPRAAMPGHLDTLARVMAPGGRLHIAVKTGEGEHRDGLGRLYTYYTIDELRALLTDAGFEIVGQRVGRDKGLSGEDADWVSIAAVRHA